MDIADKSYTLVSAIIMTYNEADNLPSCLESLAGWVKDIIVVDSYSTDKTLEIAKSFGAHIYQNSFISHPQQWQWALSSIPLNHEWLLIMDADFRITAALRESIIQAIKLNDSQKDAYLVKRLQIFRKTPLKHGGLYPRYEIRLARATKVTIHSNEGVDLRFSVSGEVGKLDGDLIEENIKESRIAFWLQKHNDYSTRQAHQEYERRIHDQSVASTARLFGNQLERKLWLKEKWYDLPLYLRPILYFVFRYFILLGFLDGKQGFIYHFLQAYWYRIIVDIKLEEMLKAE